MARGITQAQVDTAADGLLQAGERPTVEKVRAKLGTGSPNTITRMLDAWRLGLAERLRTANGLPSLPEEVGQAMTALWDLATQHARSLAQSELQTQHTALEQAQNAFDARTLEQAALLAAAQSEAKESAAAARNATAQIETLQRLMARLEAEVRERTQQCERLTAQVAAAAATEAALREQVRTVQEKADQERSDRDHHLQTIEDRAHTQVDRARTDLKAARAELADTRKRHQREVQQLQQELAELTRSLSAAERETARQRGMAEALKLKLSSSAGTKSRRRRGSSKRPAKSQKAG